jgi:hypothetical protein
VTSISFANQTATLIHADLVDDETGANYGNKSLDWDNATETALYQCVPWPEYVAEDHAGAARDAQPERLKLAVLDPGVTIAATDRIRYGGLVYEIEGKPEVYNAGVLDHQVVTLNRVVG